MRISITKAIQVMAVAVFLLVLLGSGVQIVKLLAGDKALPGFLFNLFHLDMEANLPTWYSSVTLALCSVLLLAIQRTKSKQRDPYAKHWLGLAIGFMCMSIDEMASIHEVSIMPIQRALGATGIFFFAWVIPGFIIVLVVGIMYLRFLFALPPRTRNIFILSALVFLSGALGMELIGGWLRHAAISSGLEEGLPYALEVIAEETLEMSGVLVFLFGVLDYIKREIGPWRIEVVD